jgi:hypothetical protein
MSLKKKKSIRSHGKQLPGPVGSKLKEHGKVVPHATDLAAQSDLPFVEDSSSLLELVAIGFEFVS